jgi:hypothetical protein
MNLGPRRSWRWAGTQAGEVCIVARPQSIPIFGRSEQPGHRGERLKVAMHAAIKAQSLPQSFIGALSGQQGMSAGISIAACSDADGMLRAIAGRASGVSNKPSTARAAGNLEMVTRGLTRSGYHVEPTLPNGEFVIGHRQVLSAVKRCDPLSKQYCSRGRPKRS